MFRCSHHLKVRFLGTVIILGFLLCFQSFDLNNESPLNLLEEQWLGRERRKLCLIKLEVELHQLSLPPTRYQTRVFQLPLPAIHPSGGGILLETNKIFDKRVLVLCYSRSFFPLGCCLLIATFVMHYLDLVPWHSVWQTACIALLWDRGGESFCMFLNSWFFLLVRGF